MPFHLRGIALSHQGLIRGKNQDNFNLFGFIKLDENQDQIEKNSLAESTYAYAAVYDGMGGESAGEKAAYLAALSIEQEPFSDGDAIVEDIRQANRNIIAQAKSLNVDRMGSTLVSWYIKNDRAFCCNLGDSRAYYFHEGRLRQMSKDHSEGQSMIDAGVMTEAEARNSSKWHVLTQHLGIEEEEFLLEPYFSETVDLTAGDILMLCSDGVTDMLTDGEIEGFLQGKESPEEQAKIILEKALAAGGKDNITVELIRVEQ